MKKLILISACLLTAIPAAAQDNASADIDQPKAPAESKAKQTKFKQLFGTELFEAYREKTLEGVYSSYAQSVKDGEPPVTFTEYHHDNATTTYEHRAVKSFKTIGIYSVKKDQMCYVYNDPGKVVGRFCFYVFESDGCYYHYSAASPLPSTLDALESSWTSMAYRHEDAENCLPDIS